MKRCKHDMVIGTCAFCLGMRPLGPVAGAKKPPFCVIKTLKFSKLSRTTRRVSLEDKP